MLRDLFSSRAIQAGLFFFVLVVGGVQLYSWHVRRTTAAKLAPIKRLVQTLENENKTHPAQAVSVPAANEAPGFVEMTVETPGTDSEMPEETAALPTDAALLDVPRAALAEEAQVSPFGFGPYPKLPEGWEADFPPVSVKHELMVRVAVKLHEQGVNVEGASMEKGFVFPNIRGIYYVKWDETDEGIRYITEGTGHPDDGARLHAIRMQKGVPLTEADIPADIQLVSYEEGRIEPYEFLGLQR